MRRKNYFLLYFSFVLSLIDPVYGYCQSVVITALPDFIVTSVSGTSNIIAGQTASVTIQGRNQGFAPSQTGTYVVLRAILSPDQQINLADQIYLDVNIPINDFLGGVIIGRTYSFQVPTGLSGTFYWGGYIDAATYWNESNENNNALVGNAITVQSNAPPSVPELQLPANNAVLNYNNPTFVWAGNNASYFHIQIDNNSNFLSPERENNNVSSFSWTPAALTDGTYYWRVRAYGINGSWSSWSSSRTFTINTLPDFVVTSVTGPATGTAGQFVNVTIQCRNQGNNPTQTGTHVVLRAILSPDQQINLADQIYLDVNIPINDFSGGVTLGKNFSFQIPTGLSGTFYWGGYIDATTYWNESNENNNALVGNAIALQSPAPPSVPELQLPANNAVLNYNNPTFVWAGNNASYFHIQIDDNSNFSSPERENNNVNSFSWTPAALTDGTYYWRVRAYGINGSWSSWSSSRVFTINTLPDFVVTSVTGPATGTAGQFVNVTIQCRNQGNNPTQTGTHVVLRAILSPDQQINLADQIYLDVNIPINDFSGGVTVGETFSFQIPTGLSGTFYWGGYIDAATYWNESNENNNALVGNSFLASGGAQLILTSPESNAIIQDQTITFSWTQFDNVIRYELYVDNNEGLGSPEIAPQHITDLQTLTENSFTISANWLTPDYTYYWKVFAITPDGTYESVVDSFIYSPPKQPEPTWVPLYRAFNSEFVDHFYCSAENHLAQAMDNNYTFEGTEGYVALHPFELSSPDTLKPIYRFYVPADGNPKRSCHYYTISGSDRDNRIIQGWIYEGIIGYGFNNPNDGLTKLYHTWLNVPNDRMDNFYTTSEIQKNNSIAMFGYSDQGFVGYVSMHGDNSTMTWLPSNPAIGRGINPVNGNLGHYQSNIFTIDEGLVALQYGHLYNSDAVRLFSAQQPLGNGWSHSYNAALHVTDNVVFVNWPDHAHIYNKVSLQSITPGNYDLLTKVNNNRYQIKKKNQTIYTFDKLSVSNTENTYWLTSITDRHGNTITLSYNNQGWLKWVRSLANRFISFTYYTDYEKHGLVRYVKDSLALNRTVEYIYNSSRNLIGFVDAMNQTTQFEYNTTHPYDHFLETIMFSDGSKIRNTYDSETRRIIEQEHYSDQKNNYKTFLSLPVNNQVNVTDAVGTVTGFKFDVTGNVTELITANSNVWLQFDDPANPTKPTSILQGMGNFTEIVYNAAGDPLQISRTNGGIHKYQWNSTNDLKKYTNPSNKETLLTYEAGKLTGIQNPRGTYNMTYEPNGNLLTIVNPLSETTGFGYNASNNLITVTDNLGNITGFQYDAAGRMTHSTDANNNTTVFNYNNNDLPINNVDAAGKTTQYGFDARNRLLSVTDARNNTTQMAYDDITGWIERTTDQLGNHTLFSYYDNGQIKTITTRKNQNITYSYDNSNRLSGVTAPSINRSFSYNANDMLTGLTDNNGTMNFDYDDLNRLADYTDFYGNQVQYQYDLAGNITKIIYPGNKAVDYTYYDDNLLHTITDWLGNTTTYTYRDDGSMQRLDYPNGTYLEYSYDGAGRITGMHSKKSNGEIIASYTYTLDAVGNHLSVNAQEPMEFPGIATEDISYDYDNANRISSAGETTFAHDMNGNLILKNETGTNTTFTYNAEDMLTGVSGTFNASYVYDGTGKRRAANRNGVTTRYVLDINSSMEHVLIETNSSNAPQYYYIHGHGLIYRIRAVDNATQYYHYDYRGSTITITNHAQNITHKYAYDEFGKALDAEEADFNPYRFVGGHGVMYESEELYFMRARYYDPGIGRFLSEDPLWFPNLYVYTGNNPLIFIDPLGLDDESAAKKFFRFIKRVAEFIIPGLEGISASKSIIDASQSEPAQAATALDSQIAYYDKIYNSDEELKKDYQMNFTDWASLSKQEKENEVENFQAFLSFTKWGMKYQYKPILKSIKP